MEPLDRLRAAENYLRSHQDAIGGAGPAVARIIGNDADTSVRAALTDGRSAHAWVDPDILALADWVLQTRP